MLELFFSPIAMFKQTNGNETSMSQGKTRGENVAPVSPKLAPRIGDSNHPVRDWTGAPELHGPTEDQAVIARVMKY